MQTARKQPLARARQAKLAAPNVFHSMPTRDYWLDSDDFVSTADLDAEHLGKASQHMAHATSATSAFLCQPVLFPDRLDFREIGPVFMAPARR